MAHHWQSKNVSNAGVEDLTLLSKISESAITDNLRKRSNAELMYTYIGPSLVAVNPYKSLPYFTSKEIEIYHGSQSYENPPHIYAIAERMWQQLLSDEENQCVIISGESGAGKTESAKLIMNYVAEVSSKDPLYGNIIEEIKRVILESNALLESFGNAKTMRNNNSSRFGKYFEVRFLKSGSPIGGKISNFLLEKSRVVGVKPGERNFHIFYQLTKNAPKDLRQAFGIGSPEQFAYLAKSKVFDADGINDAEEFKDMCHAMNICRISPENQTKIFALVMAILHLGNIEFVDRGNEAKIVDPQSLQFPAYLLELSEDELRAKLTSRFMRTGGTSKRGSNYQVPLNAHQAEATRDALAKELYSRMFDFIVWSVNNALSELSSQVKNQPDKPLSIGVLDIYGFEIFDKNGFEQFCINYVNERLQQIFIDLTLQQEQEEYLQEGIQWTPIDYFNNKVVVDLIDGKKPPGIMAILDDSCFTMHAVQDGADMHFLSKLTSLVRNQHYQGGQSFFTVQHYAGSVVYDVDGFTEANKDQLFKDLVVCMQNSQNAFIKALFPEEVDWDDRKRPTTAGFKIRNQCQELVATLMKCVPSYVRCIKPNESKRPGDFDSARVEHQVRYLNLKENIRVRRAGFCYRAPFDKFLRRYGIIHDFVYRRQYRDYHEGVLYLMQVGNIADEEFQFGQTKVFIRSPESLFLLEELRDRKFDEYARKIQAFWRKRFGHRRLAKVKELTFGIVGNRKERRRGTINRGFYGDYLGFRHDDFLKKLVDKNDNIVFADFATKYDREMKPTNWEILLGQSSIYLIGFEKVKEGPYKGKFMKTLKRKIQLKELSKVSLSTKADDFLVLHVKNSYDQVLRVLFKTEFVVLLFKRYFELMNAELPLDITDSILYSVKATRWQSAKKLELSFSTDARINDIQISKGSKAAEIRVPPGLPASTRPTMYTSSPSRPKPAPQNQSQNKFGMSTSQNTLYGKVPTPGQRSQPAPMPTESQSSMFMPPNTSMPARVPPVSASNPAIRTPAQPVGMGPGPKKPAPGAMLPNAKSLDAGLSDRPMNGYQTPVGKFSSMSLNESSSNATGNAAVRGGATLRPPPGAGSAASVSASASNMDANQLAGIAKKKAPPPPPPKAKALPSVRALYDFQAQDTDELSFNAGDIITVTAKDDPDWWSGLLNGRRGLFPVNYTQSNN